MDSKFLRLLADAIRREVRAVSDLTNGIPRDTAAMHIAGVMSAAVISDALKKLADQLDKEPA